ncbi:MAG: glycosyltransferase family 2 protein [Desulfomonilaceae bacterium]
MSLTMNSSSDKTCNKLGISAVIITKNEEDRIVTLLKSLRFADEIVVVDSGSSDKTLEICRSYGAKIFHQKWLGYVAQKQYAMEQASCDWILSLDADEMIPEETQLEIAKELSTNDLEIKAFSFPRLSWYLNRWIRHGGWFPDRKIRLIRRGHARWVGHALHEKLEVNGNVKHLKSPIIHYVYRNISDQITTIDSFSTVFASRRKSRFPRIYLSLGLLHSVAKFFECAIWKLGVLDGAPGLIIAVNSAFYVFLKHAKTWESSVLHPTKHRDS